jgi:starvation-inducible DNA-binding protein
MSTMNIGLSNEQIQGIAKILKRVLADEFVLYTKLHNYHWHVTGPQFHSLHALFQEQYEQIAISMDDVAERSLSVGARTIGTLEEFGEFTTLSEQPGQYPDAKTMVGNLMQDHETIIRNLRNDARECDDTYNDLGTSDFLIGLMEQHEKQAWMLRSILADM